MKTGSIKSDFQKGAPPDSKAWVCCMRNMSNVARFTPKGLETIEMGLERALRYEPTKGLTQTKYHDFLPSEWGRGDVAGMGM
jgi:hypothetical protein